jgi:hypothetical protein
MAADPKSIDLSSFMSEHPNAGGGCVRSVLMARFPGRDRVSRRPW